MEQLKALLQRDEAVGAVPDVKQPSPTAPPPSSPPPSPSTPSQAYGYDGYQGGDDSAAAGMRVKQDGSSPHHGVQDSPVRVSGGGVRQTTERRSAPPSTAQKHTPKTGSKSSMQKLPSSTSYKASRVYDRDYESDEFFGDTTDAAEKEEVKAKSVVPHVQEIVTIPCDLAEAGSAVEIMKELKRMGIDDKVQCSTPQAQSPAIINCHQTFFFTHRSAIVAPLFCFYNSTHVCTALISSSVPYRLRPLLISFSRPA